MSECLTVSIVSKILNSEWLKNLPYFFKGRLLRETTNFLHFFFGKMAAILKQKKSCSHSANTCTCTFNSNPYKMWDKFVFPLYFIDWQVCTGWGLISDTSLFNQGSSSILILSISFVCSILLNEKLVMRMTWSLKKKMSSLHNTIC